MDPIRLLTRNPAIGLGLAIGLGFMLGTGTLGDLLQPIRGLIAPPPTPAPSPASVGAVARAPVGDLGAHLDSLDQGI